MLRRHWFSFSGMKFNKSRHRSSLSENHLSSVFSICTWDINGLAQVQNYSGPERSEISAYCEIKCQWLWLLQNGNMLNILFNSSWQNFFLPNNIHCLFFTYVKFILFSFHVCKCEIIYTWKQCLFFTTCSLSLENKNKPLAIFYFLFFNLK